MYVYLLHEKQKAYEEASGVEGIICSFYVEENEISDEKAVFLDANRRETSALIS